jgi:hypothetical protein
MSCGGKWAERKTAAVCGFSAAGRPAWTLQQSGTHKRNRAANSSVWRGGLAAREALGPSGARSPRQPTQVRALPPLIGTKMVSLARRRAISKHDNDDGADCKSPARASLLLFVSRWEIAVGWRLLRGARQDRDGFNLVVVVLVLF